MQQSEGDICRILLGNLRTMCDEAEDILALGATQGFAGVRAQLQRVSDAMEEALQRAAETAGAVPAQSLADVSAALEPDSAPKVPEMPNFREIQRELLERFYGPGWEARRMEARRDRAIANGRRRRRVSAH